MLEIPSEMQTLLKYIDNGMIWLYIAIFFILMYLLISLLTWSFIKPLKYLGIPTVLVGILLIIVRLSSSIILNFTNIETGLITALLPLVLKPLVIYGIVCTLFGILMIVAYIIITKNLKNKKETNQVKAWHKIKNIEYLNKKNSIFLL